MRRTGSLAERQLKRTGSGCWLARAVFLALILSPVSAGAQHFEGARLLAFAEAQRALTTGNDSIYVNPAGMALAQAYSIELGYLDDVRGSDRRFNASVIDSQAGPVAGGLAYTYTERRPDDIPSGDERLEGHRLELSLATLATDGAAVGITARYLTYKRKLEDTEIESGSFNQFTLDAGIQWRVASGLSIGLVGYNLTNSDRSEIPVSWGAGVGYQLDTFSIESDIRYNAQIGKARYSFGAGYIIAQLVPIRAGVSYDLKTETVSISAGTGIILGRLAIDAGYRQRVSGDFVEEDDDERILGVSARAAFL